MKRLLLLICTLLLTASLVQAQTVSITFQVNMRVQIKKQAFNPSTHHVSARGSFNSWGETAMTDADGDSIYVATVSGNAASSTVNYKYFHNGGDVWESDPNRSVVLGTSDTTLPARHFNDELMPSGASANVTFEVDMRTEAKKTGTWSQHEVYVAGSFTNWATGALQMSDANNDTIYTVTTPLNSAQLVMYKFIHTADSAVSRNWETRSDRKGWIVDGAQTFHLFWNDVDPNVTFANGNILFEVNMSVATELGVFNPSTDSVQIRGGFNGWNDSQPAKSKMNQDPGNANAWYLEIPFVQEVLNSNQAYKYYIKKPTGVPEYSNTGWEVPIGNTISGDRNRVVVFQGSATQAAPVEYFENIHTNWFIPSGTSVQANFSVDMKPAMTGGTTPFNPATDSVYWIPLQPLFYAVRGLAWTTEQRILRMTDPNSDSVYTGTLTLNGPAFNGLLYNYAYTSVAGFIQEDGGQGGARVRFVDQNAPRQFVSPWTMPADVWTNGEKPEETSPLHLPTAVETLPGIPGSYSLGQNYPNPFNPSTTIRFDISTREVVQLKVYNLLGQEVMTLVNGQMPAGSYEVVFEGGKLSSGIYVYRLTAGSFAQTKRMVLIK